ncbi:three-Cys-motif partner protein TcmP [Chryseolinea sp. H1M3-3]|uniref:three-Cys-motif partner protein TcmP n=1 Tax=Chryseolinea sp. H1M3-3 TaxID=3034144 RepID=UPI0023ECA613|nr:three-Cys-motif partner protein TcmP [Chryseolinea sp. H1M3-3]
MNLKSPNDKSIFLSDGLSVTATEPWFKVKVEVIQSYLRAFVMNVSVKADEIVFVDLFTGSGLYSVGYKKEIFPGSSFASLCSDFPITQWILCERDPESLQLLERRVDRYFRRKNVLILDSELSQLPDKFRRVISRPKRGHHVAVFCLVDPFGFDIPLSIIDSLAALGFNILMPFTFMLNERSNYQHYLHEHPDKLLRYLGINNFERIAGVQNNLQFYKRIVRMYQNRMLVMGLNTALSVHKMDSRLMEVPAYYIGLFTRQFSAKAIQADVNLQGQLQIEMFE